MPTTWLLGHRRGLDQLRGLAVAIVVVGHGLPDSRLHDAGSVGVVVFFVLSGFLITRLLLEERDATGGVDLREFYLRRARRLLPALPVALILCATVNSMVGMWTLEPTLAAVTYRANYLSATEAAGGFGHLWSLAVEEHFYVAWPLLVAAAPRRVLAPVAAAVAILVVVARAQAAGVSWRSEQLAYFGTQFRIDAMLLGALLALAVARLPLPSRPLLASSTLVLALFCVAGNGTMFLAWGAAAVALATGPLVVRSLADVRVRPRLERLGQISYGMYLFHYPIAWCLSSLEVPTWIVLFATTVGGYLLAELSWRWIELPWKVASARPQGIGMVSA